MTLANSFFDDFDHYNSSTWSAADGWTNGEPFDNIWRADHINIQNSLLTLTLDDQPCVVNLNNCLGLPYASGEYRTLDCFSYGRIEARMKAAQGLGVISSLFLYSAPTVNGPIGSSSLAASCIHDEIDIEFLGKDTTKVQFNYYKNGIGGNEYLHDLGFDAADSFHNYAFEWQPNRIDWLIDGLSVYLVMGENLPSVSGRIMINLWPIKNESDASNWAGKFNLTDTTNPITAEYDWVRYTALSDLASLPSRQRHPF